MGYIRLLSVLLIFGVILVMVKAEEEVKEGSIHQLHHHLYQEEFQDPTSTRLQRDVLKGKNHDLLRSKRYIGRVPISYMKKISSPYDGFEDDEDDLISSPGYNAFTNILTKTIHFKPKYYFLLYFVG